MRRTAAWLLRRINYSSSAAKRRSPDENWSSVLDFRPDPCGSARQIQIAKGGTRRPLPLHGPAFPRTPVSKPPTTNARTIRMTDSFGEANSIRIHGFIQLDVGSSARSCSGRQGDVFIGRPDNLRGPVAKDAGNNQHIPLLRGGGRTNQMVDWYTNPARTTPLRIGVKSLISEVTGIA